jgi:hypothetical protein
MLGALSDRCAPRLAQLHQYIITMSNFMHAAAYNPAAASALSAFRSHSAQLTCRCLLLLLLLPACMLAAASAVQHAAARLGLSA